MTTDELFKSLDTDQTKALNALLIEQRDALTEAHVQGLQDMVTAKAEEIEKLVSEHESQVSALVATVSQTNERIAALERELSEKDSAVLSIRACLQNGDADSMVKVFQDLERPAKQKEVDALNAEIAERIAKRDALL